MKLVFITIKSLLGIIYFTVTVTLGINLFMDIDGWGEFFYKKMDYKVSQKFLGGEIIDIIDNREYYTRIHRSVFDGIFKNRNKGFVQIDWFSNNRLPDHISEEFDYNNDGLIDFVIDIYPIEKKVHLKKYNDKVLNLLDKTSMGLLNMRGFKDARYSIFTYHDYQESTFLDYNENELNSIDLIKEKITPEYRENFNKFLDQIIEGKKNLSILCEMKRKFRDKEQVKILFKEELEDKDDDDLIYKFKFNIVGNKKHEKLSIHVIDNTSLIFSKVLPITSFKNGNSIRVLIKK